MNTIIAIALFLILNPGPSFAGFCKDNTWVKYGETKCYKLIKQFKEWDQALAACKAESPKAELGTIKSHEEQVFAMKYLFPSINALNNVWLGASSQNNNKFYWSGGELMTYTHWNADSPNSEKGRECLEIDSLATEAKGYWKDVPCSNLNYALCEMHQTKTRV